MAPSPVADATSRPSSPAAWPPSSRRWSRRCSRIPPPAGPAGRRCRTVQQTRLRASAYSVLESMSTGLARRLAAVVRCGPSTPGRPLRPAVTAVGHAELVVAVPHQPHADSRIRHDVHRGRLQVLLQHHRACRRRRGRRGSAWPTRRRRPRGPCPRRTCSSARRAAVERRRAGSSPAGREKTPSWPSSVRGRVTREQVRRADEAGDERGRRPLVDLGRAAHLLDPARVEHRDPVATSSGLPPGRGSRRRT